MIGYSSAGSMVAAGICFMLANLFMKIFGHMPFYILYPAVGFVTAIGCYFEIVALRGVQFALAVVLILALEMLFTVAIAHILLGESYSLTNLAGIALVVIGIGFLHIPADAPAKANAEPTIKPFRMVTKPVKGPRFVSPARAERGR